MKQWCILCDCQEGEKESWFLLSLSFQHTHTQTDTQMLVLRAEAGQEQI